VIGVIASLAPGNSDAAADDEAQLAPLKAAVFVSARDVAAEVPYGSFSMEEGVVCFLPGQERRKEGLFVGDVELVFTRLPAGESVVNWIAEQALAKDGRVPKSLEFQIQAAYLNASLASDSVVQPGGRAVTIRNWEELEPEEQAVFSEVYQQSRSDSWPLSAEASEHNAIDVRDPQAKEFFAAFWGGNEYCVGSKRFDFRVDASGEKVEIAEHDSGVCIYSNGNADAGLALQDQAAGS
jgi:hypothetical protein